MCWGGLRLLVVVGVMCSVLPTYAAMEILAQEKVRVFAEPSRASDVIAILKPGFRYRVGSKARKGFRKLLLVQGGQKTYGYIFEGEINRSRILEEGTEVPEDLYQSTGDPVRIVVGGILATSYMRQQAREVSPSVGEVYDVSELGGMSSYFGIYGLFPAGPNRSLRGYLLSRSALFEGDAKLQGAMQSNQPLRMNLNFLSLGCVFQFHEDGEDWWWGAFGELAKGQSLSITRGGAALSTSGVELPFYIFAGAAAGWDFPVGADFILTPEARLGLAINADPLILMGEFFISLGYRL